MDPKPQRSQRPSLLEADASDAASDAAQPSETPPSLAGINADTHASRQAGAHPWLWVSLLVVVGVIAILALAFSGVLDGGSRPHNPSVAVQTTGSSPARDSLAGRTLSSGATGAGHAVILPGEAVPVPAPATTAAATAGVVASANADTATLSKMFAPATASAPAKVVRRATPAGHDADVALLTDLLKHVESGTPAERKRLDRIRGEDSNETIEERMQACPAANTAAGLRCRQKLCAGNAGKSPVCPEGAPGGLGAIKASNKAGHGARAAPAARDASSRAARVASVRPVSQPPVKPVSAITTKVAKAVAPPSPASQQVAVIKPAPQHPKPTGATHGVNVVHMATPEYPVAAAREHTSGYATMEFTVDPSGAVSNVHVIASSPRGVFDQAAMQVIRASQFSPAMKNGQPIAAVARRRIDFTLSN